MIGPCEETQTSEPKKNLTEDRSNNTRRKLEGPLHQSQIVKIPNAEKNHLRQPKQNRNPASLSDVVMTIVGQIDDEHDQQRKDDHIPHPEEVETLMVQEMNAMTVDQRERAYEAIHGVGEAVEESDEFVDKCLEEMGNSIQRINPKGSYIRAEQQSRSYVHDRRLRLKFLRAENFNPLEAARRLIRFFEGISKYFGPSCLTRPLRLDDLDHDDLSALKSGHLQLFSDRDSAGRVVLGDFQAMERCAYKKVDNMVRAFIYVLTCAAYDDESQKKGIVTLIYQINSPPDARVDTEMAMEGPQVFRWMPLKITAHHMCLDDPFYKQMARFVLAAAGKDFRSHYRLHEGSMTEVRYSLMSFGLPVGSNFPISPEGFIRKEAHARWLATRRAMESELEKDGSFAGIDIPRRQDILIGKGKPIQMHNGNVDLRDLIMTHWEEYSGTTRGSKREVVRKVFQIIKTSGVRFLSKEKDGWWIEASDKEAAQKVEKTFHSVGTKVNRDKASPPPVVQHVFKMRMGADPPEKRQRIESWSTTSCCFGG